MLDVKIGDIYYISSAMFQLKKTKVIQINQDFVVFDNMRRVDESFVYKNGNVLENEYYLEENERLKEKYERINKFIC